MVVTVVAVVDVPAGPQEQHQRQGEAHGGDEQNVLYQQCPGLANGDAALDGFEVDLGQQ
jgi:hypothetical protein